jgi:hypothetical protein
MSDRRSEFIYKIGKNNKESYKDIGEKDNETGKDLGKNRR